MNKIDTYVKRIQSLAKEDGYFISDKNAQELLLSLSELIRAANEKQHGR